MVRSVMLCPPQLLHLQKVSTGEHICHPNTLALHQIHTESHIAAQPLHYLGGSELALVSLSLNLSFSSLTEQGVKTSSSLCLWGTRAQDLICLSGRWNSGTLRSACGGPAQACWGWVRREQQPWRWEETGREGPLLSLRRAALELCGAGGPRFSAEPPFHGLIEYLNNPFIPARHKECCPNSGDSSRRPPRTMAPRVGLLFRPPLLAGSRG